MSSPMDMLSHARVSQGGADTASKMLDLMGDVASSFHEELEAARAGHLAKEKNAPSGQIPPTVPKEEKEAPPAKEVEAKATSPSEPKPKTPAAENAAANVPAEDKELMQRTGVPAEPAQEGKKEEVPPNELKAKKPPAKETVQPEAKGERSSVVEGDTPVRKPPEDLPKLKNEKGAPKEEVEPEVDVAVKKEALPELASQEPSETEEIAQETPTEEEVAQALPNPQKEPPQELVATASSDHTLEDAPATEDAKAPISKPKPESTKAAIEAPPPAEAKEVPEKVATPELPREELPKLKVDKADASPKEAMETKEAEAKTERKTGIIAEKGDGKTASQAPSNPSPALMQIAESLKALAGQTNVQTPVPGKVSKPVLEALKVQEPKLAQSLEGAKGEGAGLTRTPLNLKSSSSSPSSAAKGAEKPATAADKIEEMRSQVVKQMRFQLKLAMRDQISRVQMKLNPQYLGKVDIRLTLEKSAVTANFVVENQTVKDMLQRSASELQDMLREQGLEAQEIEVTVSDDHQNNGESGRAFASAEEREAVKEWIGSFVNFGPASDKFGEEEVAEEAHNDSEEVLNIMA